MKISINKKVKKIIFINLQKIIINLIKINKKKFNNYNIIYLNKLRLI